MLPAELSEVREQVVKMLEKGWIRPLCSPYGAPIIFAKKARKDSSLRMYIDYQALNAQMVKFPFPLPRIDNLLDQFG